LSLKNLWISKYLKDDLPWYFAVADNEKPAKFLIADRVPVDFSDDDNVDTLWSRFFRAEQEFLRLWSDVRYNDAFFGTCFIISLYLGFSFLAQWSGSEG